MTNEALSERIENPEMWNLLLRLSPRRLDAVIYSIIEDNSLTHHHFELDTASTPWVAAIQNVVYDHPALLSDFRKVYCVVETRDYVIIPSACDDDESRRLLFKTAFPSSQLEMNVNETGASNATVLHGVMPELRGFINRTFQRSTIVCHIAALSRYAIHTGTHGNNLKMTANLRKESIDVVVTDGRKLMLANTFTYKHTDDAVYYILAVRKRLGLDDHTDELLLAGDQSVREAITPSLRNFIVRVMPVIFPPRMFKAGKQAMNAPFDLITLPICE